MTAKFLRGSHVRVHGRPGVWTVIRDTGGKLIAIRRGREATTTPRDNVTPTKGKT